MVSTYMQPYMQKTVKAFWQGVNWENRPMSDHNKSSGFAMTLAVQDYFGMIPWSGVAIAKSIPKPIIPMDTDNSETLENFLDDISKFF